MTGHPGCPPRSGMSAQRFPESKTRFLAETGGRIVRRQRTTDSVAVRLSLVNAC